MRKLLIGAILVFGLAVPLTPPQSTHLPWSPKQIGELTDKTVVVFVAAGDIGGVGTGVMINKKGLVLTAAHVVDHGEDLTVSVDTTSSLEEHDCDVIFMDTRADLALLQIKRSAQRFKYAKLQKSNKVAVGEPVLIIGNPNGAFWTVTTGIVSRISFSVWYLSRVIETTAHIDHGSSGGPMFNRKGEVIGIVSAMQAELFTGPTGIGYAVHIKTIHKFLDEAQTALKDYKCPPRYRIGDIYER